MLRGTRGRRAIARIAQIAALAVSAVAVLSALSHAADTSANGRLVGGAGAGTINGALIEAYRNNPQLNAQRAATRAIDENVPTALSGYRPRVQAWAQLEAAKAQINATQAQVTAAEVALNGVREEARVGQRTTLDVLNAQQDLVNARVALVTAQRDRVVASYTVLAATGALSPQVLGLRIEVYDPVPHYHQVRDTWGGVRIPDGR
jgi:outer membrane protein TolC